MSNLEWFENELKQLGGENEPMQQQVNKNILDVVKAFDEGGHSGFSAGYAIPLINRLLQHKPLTPITDEPDQWNDVSDMFDGPTFQHKRCGSVFKRADGKATYGEGRVFSNDGGESWFTAGGKSRPEHLRSSIPITFPFTVPDEPERVMIEPEAE